ncbi:MAG: hypothetical protein KA175_08220 [Flavobacteriales bacterium]|nr:hypothetical protein [Flavobacteriales bacterium]MBP6697589.1 hypothetical protein [Flavobacteriales bacterium]
MRSRSPILLFWLLLSTMLTPCAAQVVCTPSGNVVLYSNYDGGPLTIHVDDSIPDLRVGVVSYEFVKITFTGPFANLVSQVIYAGYNGSNDHCGIGSGTLVTINGVPNAVTDIRFAPPATFSNTNGNGSMVCAYSCDVNANQGGCNTADQVAHYFLSEFGGVLRHHRTQYGCWTGVQAISAGGNCCEDPLATSITDPVAPLRMRIHPNPTSDLLQVESTEPLQVLDAAGRIVLRSSGVATSLPRMVDVGELAPGPYLLRGSTGAIARIMVQR